MITPKKKKEKVSRKKIREILNNFKLCVELYKIIRHFFPDLIPLLKQTKDPRNPSYIKYENYIHLFTRILAVIFQIKSMRRITEEFNMNACIENIRQMLGCEKLEELPHWSSINNYLEELKPEEIELILPKLCNRLIRMRSFEGSRIRNKYWQIIVDGVHLFSFKERHCQHCLTKDHKDKAGNIIWTEYYHCVLEAKLVLNGNIVCSIATEFIENETINVSKQDCERNAFYRLTSKLAQYFPKLPVCLTMDSLYACGPVFDICKQNNWHYIIRFKDGSIPSVAKEFNVLKEMEPEQIIVKTENSIRKEYRYVTDIPYQSHMLNIVEYIQSDLTYPFMFITDLPINKCNYESLVNDGRRRWKIENEGFNAQKNHGYELTHMFSKNDNAIKNHYLLIQIGHMIAQFIENALELWKLIKVPSCHIAELIKQSFQTTILSDTDINLFNQKNQYRFP